MVTPIESLNTHCCWLGGLQIDCSIQPSCHRPHPATRPGAGCGRCHGSSSAVSTPGGRPCWGPGSPSAGNDAWWRTERRAKEDRGPARSAPRSQTACSSPWTGSETPSGELPRCLAAKAKAGEEEEVLSVKQPHLIFIS